MLLLKCILTQICWILKPVPLMDYCYFYRNCSSSHKDFGKVSRKLRAAFLFLGIPIFNPVRNNQAHRRSVCSNYSAYLR